MDRIIETEADLTRLGVYLRGLPRPFTIKISDGRMRSVEQNRLQWLWAAEAAAQRQDVRPQDVQAEWKLAFGVPIIRADDEKFDATWSKVESMFSYEEQIHLMHVIGVTSLMTSSQISSYLDQVQQSCAEKGIELTDPERLRMEGTKRMPRPGSFDG